MKKALLLFAVLMATMACTKKNDAAPAVHTEENRTVTETQEQHPAISEEERTANMQEAQVYLKECGAFFIATVDGDQPRVRPFGVSEIIDCRLYFLTGKVKDVYKQIDKCTRPTTTTSPPYTSPTPLPVSVRSRQKSVMPSSNIGLSLDDKSPVGNVDTTLGACHFLPHQVIVALGRLLLSCLD